MRQLLQKNCPILEFSTSRAAMGAATFSQLRSPSASSKSHGMMKIKHNFMMQVFGFEFFVQERDKNSSHDSKYSLNGQAPVKATVLRSSYQVLMSKQKEDLQSLRCSLVDIQHVELLILHCIEPHHHHPRTSYTHIKQKQACNWSLLRFSLIMRWRLNNKTIKDGGISPLTI